MAALGINLGFFLFQVFNFIIVLVLLTAWAYKPMVNALENRRKKIAQSLEDARIAAEARANAEAEANKIIAEAKAQVSREVSEAAGKADKTAREIITQADLEAAKIRATAVEEAAVEKDRLLLEMRGQIAALAIAATQKLVGETLDQNRQRVLIQEFFSGVKSGKVQILEDSTLVGVSADVTSALPLTPEEREIVKNDVLSRMGEEQAKVAFHVDPSILGGLVIKVGDKVLDGSVAGQLDNLRQTLR
jgi:F-type H+-transporting ATPase subunit b